MENLKNLYEVRKTVRFSLQSLKKYKEKNENYNFVVKNLQKNEYIKSEIDKLSNRFIISSDEKEWENLAWNLKSKLKTISQYLENYSEICSKFSNLEQKNYFKLNIDLKKLKSKWGFWKTLYFSYDENKMNKEDREKKKIKTINQIWLYSYIKNENSFKKHFENELNNFEKCKNVFDIYKLFIQTRISLLNKNINDTKILLNNENHNKERLNEIYKEINYIFRNIKILNDYLFWIIKFAWWLDEKLSLIKNKINSLEKDKAKTENTLLEILEDIKNPNNWYEIWKATLHYYTLNKKSSINWEIAKYKKLLWGDYDNNLSKLWYEIVELLYQEKDNIEAKSSLIEKIIYVINLCKNFSKEEITLYDVVNCLNNKNQTYDKFITEKQEFNELWIKQRLRFALTILVDCDVYVKWKFNKYCLSIKDKAKQVLKDFLFNDYEKYKNYTYEISEERDIKKNAKERWNLFKSSALYNKAFNLNSTISWLKWAFRSYIDFLEKEKIEQEKLQFYSVLWIYNNEKILLLIDREEYQRFHKYIENKQNHKWNSYIYLYNSITIKSIEKLFKQVYSENHPFSFTKKVIFEELKRNKNLKSIDDLKNIRDLSLSNIKELLLSNNEKDISKYENWREKFRKLYEKINWCKTEKELFEIIETKWIYFEKLSFDLEDLKNKFPNLIISFIKNWTEKDFNNIHLEYFEKAIERMEKWEDIKEKLNPEILINYIPLANELEQKQTIEFYKNKIYSKPWSNFNLEFLKNNHRFWRENINVWFTVEFNLTEKENSKENFRVIWIDRWEKKLATLCNLEHKNWEISILPIKYYENNEEKYSYFLDLANFKVWVLNWKKWIIKVYTEDNNINLKKYEYLLRLQRTLWLKENYWKVKEIFDNLQKDEDILLKIENDFFDIDWLKKYRENIFKDEDFKNKIYYLLESWKTFNKKEIPTNEEEKNIWFEKKEIIEVNKIKIRENISSNITWIVDFFINENAENWFDNYISMENLHNSNWNNKTTIDWIDLTKKTNNDFIEYRHNKLFWTTIYNKIEQAILNKLQVHKNLWNYYENQSIKWEKTNYIKKIQNELKYISKAENKEEFIDLYWIPFGLKSKLSSSKQYGNIIFVDPYYTSKKCPQCWVYWEDKVKWHNSNWDIIHCTKCSFHWKSSIQWLKSKFIFKNIYKTVKTWDENWALQIWLRWIQFIQKNDLNI